MIIPKDFAVQPFKPKHRAKKRATCGTCGLAWDDAIATTYTPAPSGRCPFEAFHPETGDIECFQCGKMHDSFGIMPICPTCTRAHAAALSPTRLESVRLQALDAVRVMLAQEDGAVSDRIATMLARNYGIKPLQACAGEAHANPNIDHCSVCAPRWGWVES